MKQSAEFFFHLYAIRLQSKMCKDCLPAHIKEIIHCQFSTLNLLPDLVIFLCKNRKHFRSVFQSCLLKTLLHPPRSPRVKIQQRIVCIQQQAIIVCHRSFPLFPAILWCFKPPVFSARGSMHFCICLIRQRAAVPPHGK